jgi:hypothetical protein
MGIVMHLTWEGLKPEHYETIRELTNQDKDYPKGNLIHLVCFDDKGIRVTDVWESKEAFEAFGHDVLQPAFAKANLPGQPKIEVHPLYTLAAYGLMKR